MISQQQLHQAGIKTSFQADHCPPWCEHEHDGGERAFCGFHHDGAVVAVSLARPVLPGRPPAIFVNVSQHEQAGMAEEPAYVDVQDDHQTLALLTPAECVRLSRALLEAAAVISEQDPDLEVRLKPLVLDLEDAIRSMAS